MAIDIFEVRSVFRDALENGLIKTYNRNIEPVLSSLTIGNLVANGAGGFAQVYHLVSNGEETDYVVKVIDTDEVSVSSDYNKIVEYAEAECNSMLRCNGSKHTMPLFAYAKCEIEGESSRSIFFFIMPKLNSIRNLINKKIRPGAGKRLDEEFLIDFSRQISEALVVFEKMDILHMDLKFENIFYRIVDDKYIFVVGDFGISRAIIDDPYRVMTLVVPLGSEDRVIDDMLRNCIAPELRDGKALNGRYNSDMHFFFSLLYNRLTDFEKCMDYYTQLSDEFRGVIRRATLSDASQRYQSASEIIADLDKIKTESVYESEQNKVEKMQSLKSEGDAVDECRRYIENNIENFDVDMAIGFVEPYIRQSCSASCIYSMLMLRKSFDGRKGYNQAPEFYEMIKGLLKLLSKYVEDGNVSAEFFFAFLQTFGRTQQERDAQEQNPALARDRIYKFKHSADCGFAPAQYYYGKLLYSKTPRTGIVRDENRALYYLLSATMSDYAPARDYLRAVLNKNPRLREGNEELCSIVNLSYVPNKSNELIDLLKAF